MTTYFPVDMFIALGRIMRMLTLEGKSVYTSLTVHALSKFHISKNKTNLIDYISFLYC